MIASNQRKRATLNQALDLLEEIEGERITLGALTQFCQRHKIPRGKDGKLSVAKLLDKRAERKRHEIGTGAGRQAQLKAEKLKVEIEILESKRDELQGRLITREEHNQQMVTHAGLVKHRLENIAGELGAIFRDPEATRLAEEAVDRILEGLSAACEEAGV